MKQIEFSKINGKIDDVGALHAWVDRNLKWLMNGRHALVLKKAVRKRSIAQNRLMWLWFSYLESETGQPAQDIHDYYCLKFLPRDVIDLSTGVLTRVGGHTSTLSTQAFTDFLNRVHSDAATELGILLPSPDDPAWSEFEDEYNAKLKDCR